MQTTLLSSSCCLQVIGLTAALVAGFTIGREGPLVHLASCFACLLMRLPVFAAVEEQVDLLMILFEF